MAISSEFHAYTYIKNELKALGWNVYNPSRRADGEVYTQNECLQNALIKKHLIGEKPENVIVVRNNKFWVIEAKSTHKELQKAIEEAQGYADKLNEDGIHAPIATGIAGNDEDTYLIKSFYFYKGKWVPIEANGKVLTGLLPRETARYLVDNDIYKTEDFNLPDELYYAKANAINEILHIGSINKNNRAKVMAALLLALLEETPINLDNSASLLIQEINARVDKILFEHGRRDFARFVQITTPPTPDNHVKFRKAIIDTIQELKGLNIRSAMNSGTDILGRFYEVFLKYGNGAKEIGIVLTPRHITRLGVEILNVSRTDVVFDPACGTGGFLVAAFDYVRKHANKTQLDEFKENRIFGIEQEPEVVALALVNMIFRGDGKNNIIEGNTFAKIIPTKATKVLMNPPFALKKDDEKEYKFIDRAIEQMEDGGQMFVIIPSTIMFKGKQYKTWREKLLQNNTIQGVIKLPEDLFYPIGVHTSALILKKGIQHDKGEQIFWGYLVDGYMKKKGVMKKVKDGNIEMMKSAVIDFLNHSKNLPKSKPKEYTIAPALFDSDLELAPEYYLEEGEHSDNEIEKQMQIVLDRLFSYLMNSSQTNVNGSVLQSSKIDIDHFEDIEGVFNIANAKSSNIEDYAKGDVPFVTSTELNNGVEMFIEPDDDSLIFDTPGIAISSFGFATIQLPPFVARSHGAVIVLKPKKKMGILELAYFAAQLNLQTWRFSYGRWVTKKRLKKLEIKTLKNGDIPSFKKFVDRFEDNYKKARKIVTGE
ncbi:MAG: N-6 DNA methylase [Candidatus Doudnabacteria bacterium]|nr:N-6 DNA methylase [Candidatus Doudnabacteria bacterium]